MIPKQIPHLKKKKKKINPNSEIIIYNIKDNKQKRIIKHILNPHIQV